ncbi:SGNH/GDSL hydrolase family protein [Pseudomonas putida]|uniref:SGNH/GDSL hydrolase family protein n=1 Tax=Pseudomonas putida TaxID=303 RepID=UPI001F287AE1|nr:SGNH/GDSL hydrolase family protein [Pseudomonas putida]MCF1251933.1 SGNH/GDSL hydrolase family protein [Pseudomonas putida]
MSGAEDLARLTVTIDKTDELFLSPEIKMVEVSPGVFRPTNAKVLADLSTQMSGALIYTSSALGLAGTPSGGYFSVISGNVDNHVDVYRNDAGIATFVSSYPSTEFLRKVDGKFYTTEDSGMSLIPVVTSQDGKVPIWLEGGMLGAVNLSPALRKAATEEIVSRFPSASAQMLPLMVNSYGQVVIWLENGKVNAAGLEDTVTSQIEAALAAYEDQLKVKNTDGSRLYSYRAKIANAKAGNGIARVFFTGDSWTEHLAETARPLSLSLYEKFGQSGQGWISVHADEGGASSTLSQLLNGARLDKSPGWALADMTLAADGLDGHAVTATGTADTITITGLKSQSLKWYYLDGPGQFRYSVDGGAPVTVAGANTGLRKFIEITGLSDANHSFTFDLVGNTGSVTMFGGMAVRTSPGVEFSKAGNGGSTAVQWRTISPNIQAYAAELKPDVVVIVLGTNDRNQSISKSAFKLGIETLVAAYRAGSPNCAVILVTPTAGGVSSDLGLMASYAEAMHEISRDMAGVEYINLNEFMPPRVVTDPMGLWADHNHLSEVGGRFVADLLMKYFLSV